MGYPYIGSDDRMSYYYRHVFTGMIRGVDYMTSRPDWNHKAIISVGASQGGGLALIAAALACDASELALPAPLACQPSARPPAWSSVSTKPFSRQKSRTASHSRSTSGLPKTCSAQPGRRTSR